MDSFFIFLSKSVGQSSQQCLTQFKRKFDYKKIGHHGTLDPFARGLLLAGVGQATKFFQFIDDSKKTYEATLLLGVKTDTMDHTGREMAREALVHYDLNIIEQALVSLIGKIQQTPPMFSAIKKDGKKLYELARSGIEVPREPREIEIFQLQLLSWQPPFLKIRATVSRGTYIRVLAEQIAERLGTLAHLTELTRTILCGFDLSCSFDCNGDEVELKKCQRPITDFLLHLPRLRVDSSVRMALLQGKRVVVPEDSVISRERLTDRNHVTVFCEEEFIGVCHVVMGQLVPERLMSFDMSRCSNLL